MSSNIVSSDTNKPVCEALGCTAKAIVTVAVSVGDKESISLFLCEKCRPRFSSIDSSEQESTYN